MKTKLAAARKPRAAALLCLATLSLDAAAHITLTPDRGHENSYFQTALLVPHGCGANATVAVAVTIPAGVTGVKPQHKPGWTITLHKRPLQPPLRDEHGGTIAETVNDIEWRGGPLPLEQFDTFGLLMKLPPAAAQAPGQPLYFPVRQTCAQGERSWSDIPAPGQAWHSVPSPAPFITVLPPGAD